MSDRRSPLVSDPDPTSGTQQGAQPGLHRGARATVHLPQQGLITGDVDEPGLPRIGAAPPHPAILARTVVVPVGQPPRPTEPGLVHAQHPHRLRLDELNRAVHDDRARCTVGQDTPCAAATSD